MIDFFISQNDFWYFCYLRVKLWNFMFWWLIFGVCNFGDLNMERPEKSGLTRSGFNYNKLTFAFEFIADELIRGIFSHLSIRLVILSWTWIIVWIWRKGEIFKKSPEGRNFCEICQDSWWTFSKIFGNFVKNSGLKVHFKCNFNKLGHFWINP